MTQINSLSNDSIQRLGRVTRFVEPQINAASGVPNAGRGDQSDDDRFEITAIGTGGNTGLHSIKQLQPDGQGGFQDHTTGYQAEFAAKTPIGSPVAIGSIVTARPNGYKPGTTNAPEPLFVIQDSSALMQVRLTGEGEIDGEYLAVGLSGTSDEETPIFDGGDYPQIIERNGTPGLFRSDVETIVEITMTPNGSGSFDAYFSAEQPPALAVVTSQNREEHRITASEINPDGSLLVEGRSFGSVRVLTQKMPELGQEINLEYGRMGNGLDWYTTQEQGDAFLAQVTSSAAGSVEWSEVAFGTHAIIPGARTGSASLPNGYQSMVSSTIVEILPGAEGVYSVGGVVRGVRPEEGAADQTGTLGGNNPTGFPITNWTLDEQSGTGGLQCFEVGNAFIDGSPESPLGLVFDSYRTSYTSEGQVSERIYDGSVLFFTDNQATTADQVNGHISFKQQGGDESGNPAIQPVLTNPTINPTFYTRTINIQPGEGMSGGGTIDLTFDNSGRYNGGTLTDAITIDAGDGFTTNHILASVTGGGGGSVSWSGGGTSGSASLPNGWQSMASGTDIEVMPAPGGGFNVAGVVRGRRPGGGSANQRGTLGGNSPTGFPITNWTLDEQSGSGGLQAIEVGNAFIDGSSSQPRGLVFDSYRTSYTSEGHIAERVYDGSVGFYTDNEDSGENQVPGHISFKQAGDESGNAVLQPVLVKPLEQVDHNLTIEVNVLDSNGQNQGMGTLVIPFDSSGRYNGGEQALALDLQLTTTDCE